jgi:hypothetical protein
MAENREQPKVPTHRAFTVIRREGQDDFWLNLGLVFPHKDGGGFNIMLQALPIDGKIVCRRIEDDNEHAEDRPAPRRSEPPRREGDGDQVRSRPSRQR